MFEIYMGILTVLASGVMTYIVGRLILRNTKNQLISSVKTLASSEQGQNIIIDLIENMLQYEDMQKALYTVGGLIGSGARKGLGIQKSSGKFSLTDIAIQIGAEWLGLNKIQGESQPLSNRKQSGLNIE